jgi:hypothetical protein
MAAYQTSTRIWDRIDQDPRLSFVCYRLPHMVGGYEALAVTEDAPSWGLVLVAKGLNLGLVGTRTWVPDGVMERF